MIWAALRAGAMPAVVWAALAFSVIPLGQFAFGQIYFSGDAWLAWLYLAGFGLAALAGTRVVLGTAQISTPLKVLDGWWAALVLSALVSAALAIHQWLDLGLLGLSIVDMPPGARPFANLAQPNQLATLLLLGIAGLIFLFESRCLRAWPGVLAALLLISGLVMTGSRSVLLSLVWFCLAYGLLRKRCGLRTSPVVVFGLSLYYVGLSLLWPALNKVLLLGPDSASALVRMETPGMRLEFWQAMLDATVRAPWVGYGWGQVGIASNVVALDHPATHGFYDSAHNLFLDLVLQNGVPVGLIAGGSLVAWCVWQIRRCRDPLSWSILIGIGFVFSHAMLEYPLKYAFFLLPVGFLMGTLSAVHPSPLDQQCAKLPPGLVRLVLKTFAAASFLIFATVAFEYPAWEEEWRQMRYAEVGLVNPAPLPPPTPLLLTQISELIRFARTEAAPGMSESQLEWMRHISERYGYPSSFYRYALALALNGHSAEAGIALRKLCSMDIEKSCVNAKKNWGKLTQGKYPQLVKTPFPDEPAN
ncbi:PglL family O-oligosaccharyltransferase [Rhodoferax ferrireducens]|uniref:PglL family O-oligosaccharyltransferase n=1 Tax=Rhodoferax ferrireducens TaxID=192843 RepID=UPI000E0CE74C|nr:O-antigen ligase family protein [Rhodoferax ferrireducens]